MTSRIQQLETAFDPLEDRLILKFHTESREEYRLWLTRRFVKLLWQTLVQLLQASEKSPKKRQEEAQRVIEAFEKEQTLKKSSFIQKYGSSITIAKMPLGEKPILITKITVKQAEGTIPVLCLHPADGKGFEITAQSVILHALCKLLSEAVLKAEWDLTFKM